MHSDEPLVQALIYLSAAVVFVPIASKLKLGSVLGYLIAGCVIGPFGLKLVRNVQSILQFSEFGVVFMLFVIGLELEPKRLWSMRRAVFGGGALQMGAVALALAPALMLVGLSWQGALVASLAMALSSTAIAVQTMNERRALDSPTGRTSFAILLFQDIAAIPLIALVPLLSAQQTAGGNRLLSSAKAVGAIVAVIVLGRFVLQPILRTIARTHLREVFTAFALLLVIAIASLMHMVEVSMGLGAFLAGVLLASSEYRHALETDIEPFKGLLMGLFFIAVGMSIDFSLFKQHAALIVALVAGFAALKGAALASIASRLGVDKRERLVFAALLSQGGEFAFVVFGVAQKARLLPGAWDGLLTLTVALSMAATPLLLLAIDALNQRTQSRESRAPDVVDEHSEVIIAGFGRFGQIVGRVLLASGIKATVLDHDPDQIDVMRRFGFRVFYGDATRTDLLESAGAAKAKVIVNAIDDVEANLALVDHVRAHFPQVKVMCRARNVTHYYELKRRGVVVLERELFEGSLVVSRAVLEALGVGPYEARERIDRFRRLNIMLLERLAPHFDDEGKRVAMAKSGRDELEQQIQREISQLDEQHGKGWHED
ncbi:MAG: glutathione-regulated potassium-efflux system protein KefC [Myxococcales bacterium]|nr:glutathione-regulated potassium-efflux system protein KefC [Myxococcales bacterium]